MMKGNRNPRRSAKKGESACSVETSCFPTASHLAALNFVGFPLSKVRRCGGTPQIARPLPVDFERAADLWDEVQTFMREKFLR
jgi:hypothetical protein